MATTELSSAPPAAEAERRDAHISSWPAWASGKGLPTSAQGGSFRAPKGEAPLLVRFVTAFALGTLFGFVLDRSDVMLPGVIRAQMVFTRQAMIKMWCAALAVSAVIIAISALTVPARINRIRRARPYGEKGLTSLALGGLIQGSGMCLSGACPGMVMGQIGSSIPDALYTWAGCFIGAFLFHVVHPSIKRSMQRDFKATLYKVSPSTGLIDQLIAPASKQGVNSRVFPSLTLLLAFVVAIVVLIFELVFPWVTDQIGVKGGRLDYSGLLNPTAAGVVVGSLQLPCIVILCSLLGTSTAYSVLVSQPLRVAPKQVQEHFSYSAELATSSAWWQVVYGAGAVLGGYLSSSGVVTGPARVGVPDGVGPGYGLVGGALLMFGARLAGGCASGHGISGLAILSIPSWIVIPGMWAGGIITGFILKAIIGDEAYYLNV